MSIAINDDHRALADTVADFLTKRESLAAARALLESAEEPPVGFWADAAGLGWLGLSIAEEFGGSGYSLEESVVVVEQLGRYLAPDSFVPTIAAGAVLDRAAGAEAIKARWLPGLADGSVRGAVAMSADLTVSGTTVSGTAEAVIGGGHGEVLLFAVGNDVAVVDAGAPGVTRQVPANLDPTRRSARVTLDAAPVELLPDAANDLIAVARTLYAAEAAGVAAATTEMAADYAKVREQFGRPIAMYQAVKHHCANMAVATELAISAVWDAARASIAGGDQFAYTAAVAATLAAPAADMCAQLNIQVHGGIGFTWEHDAHLYLRRGSVLAVLLDPEQAAIDVVDLTRDGVRRERSVDLPPEADSIRTEVRAFVDSIKDLDDAKRREKMIDEGYAMPHWPKPYGRGAKAVEQLVIEQEFGAAGINRPAYGITGWIILTLIQYATPEQIERWVRPALNQELIWCQLFSEPDAGSDAAGIKTSAKRVDGGWLINGQKVWTSGAHLAKYGFATVRTDPDAPKHNGITIVVIDMQGDGVEVRPLKMPTGNSEFNEVFFNDVFVPDDDVVGPVDDGWTVARATLGNESVSIGGGGGAMTIPGETMIPLLDAHAERLAGGAGRLGRYMAQFQAMGVMNLRSAHRAVAGGEPGPEGNITKLLISELGHEASAIMSELNGPNTAYLDGDTLMSGMLLLWHRGLSIAGGTSEIKRNQIGERILGLPRDPLIK
jgi:alkylation response protein AidB-like acyl-CoA dehydrogenase